MVFNIHGWRQLKLEEIAEIVGGGTPARENQAYWEGDIPWLTPSDVTSSKTQEMSSTREYITELGLKSSSAKLLPIGTVMMTSRATIGECAINTTPMTTNQGFSNFICKSDSYNKFLYYLLYLHRSSFEKLGTGSTFKEISKKTLKAFEVMVPPLNEQRKIADILTAVDNAISKTEAIINQTEKVKKGLMQQLLTKGIGHTKFKQTDIGEIPEEWEVQRIEDIAIKVTDGEHKTPKRSETGKYLLSARNVKNGFLLLDNVDYVPEEEFLKITKRCNPEIGDILISCSGTIGNVCVVPRDVIFALVRSVALVKPDFSKIESFYLMYVLQSSQLQSQMRLNLSQLAQANLFLGDIKELKIPLPSKSEQKQIVKILSSVDEKNNKEQFKLKQLNLIKKGLMQVLLTGQVRVKVDVQEAVIT